MSKNIRLNEFLRDKIMKSVMIHQLQPEYTAICEKTALLVFLYYKHLVPKHVRELPEGILGKSAGYQLKVGDDVEQFHFSGEFRIVDAQSKYTSYNWFKNRNTEMQPFPYSKLNGIIGNLQPGDGDKWYDEFKSVLDRQTTFVKKFNDIKSQTNSLLYSFASVQKLIEAWPEVQPFIPADSAPPALPSLPISELNRQLGLP